MTKKYRVAVVAFPGNNCEVETLRAIRAAQMDPVYVRWNSERSLLQNIDAYILPGGFSYEDRGRSGMIAARDPIFEHIGAQAAAGVPVVGICNGAQMLIESGLVPNGSGLRMCLAHNLTEEDGAQKSAGFLSEWVWIKRTCAAGRAVCTHLDKDMHIPIAHGEGRFTTRDSSLLQELQKNDQIAFRYCDALGAVSEGSDATPNGSLFAIAGICNPEGNVLALMPHPERSLQTGLPFFHAVHSWLEGTHEIRFSPLNAKPCQFAALSESKHASIEIYIGATIVNNEERTIEKAIRRIAPEVTLSQWKYFSGSSAEVVHILADLTHFNPHKERAYIRRHEKLFMWNAQQKVEIPVTDSSLLTRTILLRKSVPDLCAKSWGDGSASGVAYAISGLAEELLSNHLLLEIFFNPHDAALTRLRS
jgi:phosphoribosylformylglycinamidine synthase subunit PurQ / glutaminase